MVMNILSCWAIKMYLHHAQLHIGKKTCSACMVFTVHTIIVHLPGARMHREHTFIEISSAIWKTPNTWPTCYDNVLWIFFSRLPSVCTFVPHSYTQIFRLYRNAWNAQKKIRAYRVCLWLWLNFRWISE